MKRKPPMPDADGFTRAVGITRALLAGQQISARSIQVTFRVSKQTAQRDMGRIEQLLPVKLTMQPRPALGGKFSRALAL